MLTAPSKVLNWYQLTHEAGDASPAYVLLSYMEAHDAEREALRDSLQAIADGLEAGETKDSLESLADSLVPVEHPNPFREVLNRLAPWSRAFFYQSVANWFGDKAHKGVIQ